MPERTYQIDQRDLLIRITDNRGSTVEISSDVLPALVGDLLRLLYPDLPLVGEWSIAAPDAKISALAQLGKEWSKPAKRGRRAINRIYFDPLHGWYGLFIDPDRNATFRGQPCTRNEAIAIVARFAGAKVYFDEMTKTFHGTQIGRDEFEFIVEQIRTLERRPPGDPA